MCNENETQFDNEGYSRSLDKLVSMSEKEYYVHLVDINRHQVIVAKTLIWLSIVIIGSDVAVMEWAYSKSVNLPNLLPILTPCYIFIVLSILTGVVSFGFAVFAIPAFGGYKPLYDKSWAEYAAHAYEHFDKGSDSVYEITLNKLLTNLDLACSIGNETNASRGLKLRAASIGSIVSAFFAAIGFIIFSFNYYL